MCDRVPTELPADQYADLIAILSDYHRAPDEFDVVVAETRTPSPQPLMVVVTMRHRASLRARHYQAGSGSDWLTVFAHDLAAGIF